jgi:1,4-dihydroxy-6-naphthoate synthase
VKTTLKTLTIGHSPDADDAFMFYALAEGKVTVAGYDKIAHAMQDIESLNHRALRGELDVTAISAAVYPYVFKDYRIMACGASVGRSYGPIVLSSRSLRPEDLAGKRIAIPGIHTTAYLLLRLYMPANFQPVVLPFERVMDAIKGHEVEAGAIIHEGQLTWRAEGLEKVIDLGEAWTADTSLPIPLGLDVIHRRLGEDEHRRITAAVEESIRYAREHEDEAIDYAIAFGRGIDRETCRKFVRMYGNDDTLNMGWEGKQALGILYQRAFERDILPPLPKDSSTGLPLLDIVGLK